MQETIEVGSRRRYRRFGLQIPAVFTWKNTLGKRQQGSGTTRDISFDGVFIVAELCPPLQSCVHVEIKVPPVRKDAPSLLIATTGYVSRTEKARDTWAGFAVHSRYKLALRKAATKLERDTLDGLLNDSDQGVDR